MSLNKVTLTKDLYTTILEHGLTTEKEEVIGLLLGDWLLIENEKYEAKVTNLVVVVRSDKRKDRVEVAPEQLHEALIKAEEIEKLTNKRTRVVGWYHSHPHITVLPSQVDLRTQASQQSLDNRFFGLILSCYDVNSLTKIHNFKLTCFQTFVNENNKYFHSKVKLNIINESMDNGLGSRLQIINQLFNETRMNLKNNLEGLPKEEQNNIIRSLGVVQACLTYKHQLFNLLTTYLYPSLDSLNFKLNNFIKIQDSDLSLTFKNMFITPKKNDSTHSTDDQPNNLIDI